MAGGNQGSTGGQGLGGFGGGFGQSFGLGGGQPSYGGFGGGFGQSYNAYAPNFGFGQGQGLYSPSTGVGGSGYIQGTGAPIQTPAPTATPPAPTYGNLNQFSAKDLTGFINANRTPQATVGGTTGSLPTATPTSATPDSGNAVWDKLVSDFTASHPNFQPGQGWQVNPDTQAAYADLAKQYQDAVAKQQTQATAAPTYDYNGQKIMDAMQQYGVSAHDLAASGALSPEDYTRTFRPSYQTQSSLNPNQYYQPIYQTQYQNYASPAYASMANANGMGLYNQRAQQQYVNPMSYLGGSFNPYTNSSFNPYAGGIMSLTRR